MCSPVNVQSNDQSSSSEQYVRIQFQILPHVMTYAALQWRVRPPGTKELDRIKANRNFQVDPKLAALSYQAELKELNDRTPTGEDLLADTLYEHTGNITSHSVLTEAQWPKVCQSSAVNQQSTRM
jgi:hypothetical protein